MGFGGGSDTSGKLITYLIMPLKIAAALSLSFVMISVLIDVTPQNHENFITFGTAIAQFEGGNGFGILWKVATVVIFWKAAFWAVSGTEIDGFIQNTIKTGAETTGGFLAKAATIDRQVLPMPGSKEQTSLSTILRAPTAFKHSYQSDLTTEQNKDLKAMSIISEASANVSENVQKLITKISPKHSGVEIANAVRDTVIDSKVLDTRDNAGQHKTVIDGIIKAINGSQHKDKTLIVQKLEASKTGNALTTEEFRNILKVINPNNKGQYTSDAFTESSTSSKTKDGADEFRTINAVTKEGGGTVNIKYSMLRTEKAAEDANLKEKLKTTEPDDRKVDRIIAVLNKGDLKSSELTGVSTAGIEKVRDELITTLGINSSDSEQVGLLEAALNKMAGISTQVANESADPAPDSTDPKKAE